MLAQVALRKISSCVTLIEAASLCSSLMTPTQNKTRGSSAGLSNRYHNGPLETDVLIIVYYLNG